MRVQDYIGKISWTVAEKALFLFYGVFVTFVQIRALTPEEYGLFGLLITLQTWVFTIADGMALQGIIQFGAADGERKSINTYALAGSSLIAVGVPLMIALVQHLAASAGWIAGNAQFSRIALLLPLYCLITIPKMFTMKLLLRDVQMKHIFWVNFSWFGTMTAMTLWMILHGTFAPKGGDALRYSGFESMVQIAFTGMAVSSVAGILAARKMLVFTRRIGQPLMRKFLGFGTPQALLGAIGTSVRQLDVAVIQYFFGSLNVVGLYTAAKTLYRVFEQGSDAVYVILYPAAIRLVHESNTAQLRTVIAKAVSFAVVAAVASVAVLELGGTALLVSVLGSKYQAASGFFNVLVLGAVFLPFVPIGALYLAFNDSRLLLLNMTLSALGGLAALVIASALMVQWALPLGMVVFGALHAIQNFLYARRTIGLSIPSLLRAIPDTLNFVKSKVG